MMLTQSQPAAIGSQIAPQIGSQYEEIENPVTGDYMTILQSSQTSQGAYTKIQFDLPPGAKGSPLHYHTRMSETFTVISGALEMEIGGKGKRRVVTAGDQVHVPAGMHHSFRNASGDWVKFTTENRPAEGFEQFIRGMFGLAIDGKVDADGMPKNLLQMALLLKKADTVLVDMPLVLQMLLVNTLTGIAVLVGTEQSLHKYWNRSEKGEQ